MTTRLLPLTAAVFAAALSGCGAKPAPEAQAPVAAAPTAAPALGDLPEAPVAAKKPHDVVAPHGATRNDEYYWLRDDKRENPEMLAYLNAENAYADAVLKPLEALEETLYAELVARVKQDDSSVPYLEDGYWYYTRFETGKEYPVYARRKGTMDAPEQVLFEVNQLAEGKDYFQIGDFQVSPDDQWVAWAEDDVGRRQYTVRIKNIATGEVLPDVITGVSANMMWGDDSRTLYYVENDPVTLLTKRVKAHVVGTANDQDALVYEETDDTFYMGVTRTRSDEYLCIGVSSTVSSEMRCTPAAKPGEFTVVAPRQRDF